MITILPSKTTPLTAEVCRNHAALPQIKGDRELKAPRLAELRRRYDQGLFHDPEWAIVYYKGGIKRANGKHSANMLLGLEKFPTNLNVRVKRFQATTAHDLAIIFEQFDSRFSLRSRDEATGVHRAAHEELEEIAPSRVSAVVGGIAWHLRATTGKVFNEADQRELIHTYPATIALCAQYSGTRQFKKTGILAAMFATYEANKRRATDFWKAVSEQNHPDNNNASRTLGKFLEKCVYNPYETNTDRKWDTRAYYAKCIHAWNAYLKGEITALKYFPDAELPVPRKS